MFLHKVTENFRPSHKITIFKKPGASFNLFCWPSSAARLVMGQSSQTFCHISRQLLIHCSSAGSGAICLSAQEQRTSTGTVLTALCDETRSDFVPVSKPGTAQGLINVEQRLQWPWGLWLLGMQGCACWAAPMNSHAELSLECCWNISRVRPVLEVVHAGLAACVWDSTQQTSVKVLGLGGVFPRLQLFVWLRNPCCVLWWDFLPI